MTEEQWLKHPTKNIFISNLGNIKDKNGNLLKQVDNGNGYKVCKREYVHRMVAKLFCENPMNKPQVNHIDGNKSNNNSKNLEWVTAQENIQHAYDIGLMENTRKAASIAMTKTNKIVDRSGERTPLQKEVIKKWTNAGTEAARNLPRTEKQMESWKKANDAAAESNGTKIVAIDKLTGNTLEFRSVPIASKLENVKKGQLYKMAKENSIYETEKFIYKKGE